MLQGVAEKRLLRGAACRSHWHPEPAGRGLRAGSPRTPGDSQALSEVSQAEIKRACSRAGPGKAAEGRVAERGHVTLSTPRPAGCCRSIASGSFVGEHQQEKEAGSKEPSPGAGPCSAPVPRGPTHEPSSSAAASALATVRASGSAAIALRFISVAWITWLLMLNVVWGRKILQL